MLKRLWSMDRPYQCPRGKPSASRAQRPIPAFTSCAVPLTGHWYFSSYRARLLVLQIQCWDWLDRCQYTVTERDGLLDQQVIPQHDSTLNCLSGSVLCTQIGRYVIINNNYHLLAVAASHCVYNALVFT